MDFVMMYRLISLPERRRRAGLERVRRRAVEPRGGVEERSVATGNQRVDIPDVSGGRWNVYSEHPVFREV